MPLKKGSEIGSGIHFCRYCGKSLETKITEQGFFSKEVEISCDCSDVLLIKEIDNKIEELEKSRPEWKYRLNVSYSIGEIDK